MTNHHDLFADYMAPAPIEWQMEIVTPDGEHLHAKPWLVELTTTDGQIGVMPGHAPLLVNLDLGELVIYEGEQRTGFLVSGGLARITPGRLSVLAFSIEQELDESAHHRCEVRRKELEN